MHADNNIEENQNTKHYVKSSKCFHGAKVSIIGDIKPRGENQNP